MKIASRIDASGTRCIAHFSDDEVYRYYLEWSWNEAPLLTVCMLNPSTATHEFLDPTIRGLIKRAHMWRFGGVSVVNLFAFRSPSPREMKSAIDPIGPENDRVIRKVVGSLQRPDLLIAAWGNDGMFRNRGEEVLRIFGSKPMVFELNGNGTPKHPLYVRHSVRPSPWVDPIFR